MGHLLVVAEHGEGIPPPGRVLAESRLPAESREWCRSRPAAARFRSPSGSSPAIRRPRILRRTPAADPVLDAGGADGSGRRRTRSASRRPGIRTTGSANGCSGANRPAATGRIGGPDRNARLGRRDGDPEPDARFRREAGGRGVPSLPWAAPPEAIDGYESRAEPRKGHSTAPCLRSGDLRRRDRFCRSGPSGFDAGYADFFRYTNGPLWLHDG